MAFLFTEEEQLLQQSAREFLEQEVMPALAEQMKKGKPFDIALGLWPKLAEQGFIGIATPESMGGLGMGVKTECAMMEILGVGASLGTNIDAHNLLLNAIVYNGSDYQKEKYGIPAAKGEIMCAAAVTDPAGSMNFPEWSFSVREEEDGYVLNGTKVFCSNSQGADLYGVFANDYENGYPMGCYLVEAGTPGLTFGEIEELCKNGENTGTVYFSECKIPKENKMPSGDFANAGWLSLGYLDCAAVLCGCARFCLEKTKAYVKTRTRNGKPLYKLQAVAHRIVNMEMELELARAVMYSAAELWDAGKPDLKLHSYAKIAASEAFSKIAHDCTIMHGAYGFAPETGLIGLHTFAPAGHVGECPNDFHRDLIAGLLGLPQDSWLGDPVKKAK